MICWSNLLKKATDRGGEALDERTLRVLEFDKIRRRLAEYGASSLGKEMALKLSPVSDVNLIREWQQETTEAVRLLEVDAGVPLGGLHDIRPLLIRAAAGGMLLPEQLLEIADTLRCIRLLRAYLLRHEGNVLAGLTEGATSLLAERARSMDVFLHLEQEIGRCIGPEGEVVDAASPTLARIRQQLRTLQGRVRDKLEAILRSASAQKILQDNLITLRNGRYVLPVKQEYRSSLPGIVHDQSGSGATLFVEPMAIVELNNEIRRVEAEEQGEIKRILNELSDAVGQESVAVRRSVEIAGELDFIFAKGRLSLEWNCTEPEIRQDGWVSILSGRHPLLTGRVVPIDVWLGREFLALIITGPNTGGKTVTLKTVGLFALMSQAGLHVPAQGGTELAVFDGIYADIGDEQSIEQNLSTFSSHMSNIVRILERATSNSLVLLDELGAGTDPTEGAALAMSILEYLIDLGCRTVATTHYSELKSFAFTEPAAENASVEFDIETLQPTFRLAIGVAGSSNAFAIARRLGLAESIVERAKARLTQEEITVEELIRTVEENRRQAVRDREEAARLRAEMQALRDRYDQAFSNLQRRRQEILDQARRQAEHMLAEGRKELEQLIGELRRNQQADLERAAQRAREQIVERQLSLREAEPLQPEIVPEKAKTGSEPLRKGDTVRIRSLGQEAVVLAEPDQDDRILVQAGIMRLSLMRSDVEKLAPTRRTETQKSSMAVLARAKSTTIATELDLRGKTVEEALDEVDKYIDDCMLSGIPRVRIIHGKGTGALRQAIREHLQGLPQVKAYREGEPGEGGSGVTIVEF